MEGSVVMEVRDGLVFVFAHVGGSILCLSVGCIKFHFLEPGLGGEC
jgi:hypothetical protein